jgi:hypothetical protein
MKSANARDFVGEALAANDIQPEAHVSSDHGNNHNGAGDGSSAAASPVGFTMDPDSGLFVEIIKKSETETKWLAAPFEVVAEFVIRTVKAGRDCYVGVTMTADFMNILSQMQTCTTMLERFAPGSRALVSK